MSKMCAMVKETDGEEYFLTIEEDTTDPVLVESTVTLLNTGFKLFDNVLDVSQLVKDCAYPKYKLVVFDKQPNGKPFLVSPVILIS